MKSLTIMTTLVIGALTFGTDYYSLLESISLTIIPSLVYTLEKVIK